MSRIYGGAQHVTMCILYACHVFTRCTEILGGYPSLSRSTPAIRFFSNTSTRNKLKNLHSIREGKVRTKGGTLAALLGVQFSLSTFDTISHSLWHDLVVYRGSRQILNLQEILDQCNNANASNWAERLKGTRWTSVECRAYSFGKDLFEGMAVAQQADAFISLHGSGEMNSMFMRRDTIKIQMRQKDFGTVER